MKSSISIAVVIAFWCASLQPKTSGADEPREDDAAAFRYKTACGPIAGYVALRTLGCDVTLDEVAVSCRWEEGAATTLQDLCDSINSQKGMTCRGVRLSPEQLQKYASSERHVVILVIKNSGDDHLDHVVCVTGARNEIVEIVDYPKLGYEIKLKELSAIWEGQALLVSRDSFWTSWEAVLSLKPAVLALLSIFVLERRRRVAPRQHAVRRATKR